MGLTFSIVGAAGMMAAGVAGRAGRPAYAAALVNLAPAAAAGVLLVKARRRVAVLSRRRLEIEAEWRERVPVTGYLPERPGRSGRPR